MLIKSRKPWELPYSEVTPEVLYRSRRDFLRVAAAGAVGAVGAGVLSGCNMPIAEAQGQLPNVRKSPAFHVDDPPHTWEQITTYNNYYEFGTRKTDPAMYADALTVKPWTVKVDGHVAKPADYAYDDLVKPYALEERIYRFRCVERWSAIIPWVGFPLADLVKRLAPTSRAKYIAFETLERPSEMRGQHTDVLEWPYVEGLRMDEAMHPLTLMVVGLYGRELPKQNGAPIRLIVPWKYGFKSIKSIVRMRFVENEPPTAWNKATPNEYGFYSNVNPDVDHPRWSQKREKRLGELLMNRPTVLFNGYGEQVASLYAGMDLKKYY
jgi:methionine sulfoxide reductase catalytic subunit